MGFRLYANLWTLLEHPTPRREWSLERKLDAIAEAGFDGVTGSLDGRAIGLARERGLEPIGWFWALNRKTIREGLALHAGEGVRRVTVFLGRRETAGTEALELARLLWRESIRRGLHAAPETHRGTATETPEKTAGLLQAFRRSEGVELPITWDFSHHALVAGLEPAAWEAELVEPFTAAIVAAELFHLRPFNGHRAQVPLWLGGRRTPEGKQFLAFVSRVIRRWAEAPGNASRELWACPEFGPVGAGYGLRGEPAAWEQAVGSMADLRQAARG
jgi:hypothetical protein